MAVCWFLQLRFMRNYLLNGSISLRDSGSFFFPFFSVHRVFGHFSLRSEWQLVKVDYKSIFSRRCNKDDYQTWHLHNQVLGLCREGMRGAPFQIFCNARWEYTCYFFIHQDSVLTCWCFISPEAYAWINMGPVFSKQVREIVTFSLCKNIPF